MTYEGAGARKESDIQKLRVPMPPRFEIVVEDFVGFIAQYASNISSGGMFLSTNEPLPVGNAVEFDIRLQDGFSLIRGSGSVAWVRSTAEGTRPAGMGVRFHTLEGDSLPLVEKIVANYVAEGGIPFELDREAPMQAPPAAPGPAGQEPPPPQPPEPAQPPVSGEPAVVLQPPGLGQQPESPPVAQPAASSSVEATDAMRALGENQARAMAPGLDAAQSVESQADRARAPKPLILSDSVDETAPPGTAPSEAATSPPKPAATAALDPVAVPTPTPLQPPPDMPGLAAPDAPPASTAPESPLTPTPAPIEPWQDRSPRQPQESAPEEAGSPDLDAGDASQSASHVGAINPFDEPSLDLDLSEGGVSLDSDDDLSIDFDRTPGPDEPDAVPETDDEASAPDLSATLGAGMVGAGTGFQDVIPAPGASPAAEAEDPLDLDPGGFDDELGGGSLDLSTGLDGGEDFDADDLPDLSWDDGLPDLGAGDGDEVAASPAAPVANDEELIGADQIDDFLDSPEVVRGRTVAVAGQQQKKRKAKPVRVRRPGQVRRWSMLLLLLGLAGGGAYTVREKGVEFALGPGSEFVVEPQRLSESEELAELEVPTLFDVLQEENPSLEIEQIVEGRERQLDPVTVVENVTWREEERTTAITLWGNGDFTTTGTAVLRIDGETARAVLQLRGVEKPYWAGQVRVGTRAVQGLRFGFLERRPFSELHVAIDFARSRVRIRRVELQGARLTIYIR